MTRAAALGAAALPASRGVALQSSAGGGKVLYLPFDQTGNCFIVRRCHVVSLVGEDIVEAILGGRGLMKGCLRTWVANMFRWEGVETRLGAFLSSRDLTLDQRAVNLQGGGHASVSPLPPFPRAGISIILCGAVAQMARPAHANEQDGKRERKRPVGGSGGGGTAPPPAKVLRQPRAQQQAPLLWQAPQGQAPLAPLPLWQGMGQGQPRWRRCCRGWCRRCRGRRWRRGCRCCRGKPRRRLLRSSWLRSGQGGRRGRVGQTGAGPECGSCFFRQPGSPLSLSLPPPPCRGRQH